MLCLQAALFFHLSRDLPRPKVSPDSPHRQHCTKFRRAWRGGLTEEASDSEQDQAPKQCLRQLKT